MSNLEDAQAINHMINGIFETSLGWTGEGSSMEETTFDPSYHVAAEVDVFGAWKGKVIVSCEKEVARKTAAQMFRIGAESLPLEAVHDAIGELSNMIGGNLTTFLPEVCNLSTPKVTTGEGRFNTTQPVWRQCTVRGPHGPVEVTVSDLN
ncbi:MAG: chemotaxis protein CheX [Gemmatimonadota bacterium]|nr:chemotaxis protein CheX [Gemmatimonadota bacterium]